MGSAFRKFARLLRAQPFALKVGHVLQIVVSYVLDSFPKAASSHEQSSALREGRLPVQTGNGFKYDDSSILFVQLQQADRLQPEEAQAAERETLIPAR